MTATARVLLERLADGEFHSGERLAADLGISRAAVWKAVQGLQDRRRVEIHSVRGRGYRLARPLELLNPAVIEAHLPPERRARLEALEILDSVDSTNAYLAAGVRGRGRAPRVCVAEQQTGGRGRRGRPWVSPFGANIYLSIYWHFEKSLAGLQGLSLVTGVAVARAIERLGIEGITLKWPNDIHVRERKLAGVLVEGFGQAEGPTAAVVGVGVNLDMPPDHGRAIDQPWIDLRALRPTAEKPRNPLCAYLVDELMVALEGFARHGASVYLQEWRRYDGYLGRVVNLVAPGRRLSGIYRGVDDTGGLLLETTAGVRTFHAGEVSLRAGDSPVEGLHG
ncbi:MAG: bifunctional biotin--[acetyl-CoA-carboxylase] ligase/biotin operon repressor BirA [Pseudomonadota bacterium]